MTRKRLIFLILVSLPFLIIVSSLIGLLIRLINFQTIIISIILITLFSRYARSPLANKIINKIFKKKLNYKYFNSSIKSKKDAAKQSLESLDYLIKRIQNNVEVEALKQERERVEDELSRGDLEVVIFGTGSSGKTSLIRALLNEIVGDIAPSFGSTIISESYRLRLRGINRGIQLIDTPGILEGGEAGRLREKDALTKASRADLMIVVVDRDLRKTEFKMIKSLAMVGKRLFLVLNKVDLLGIEEERRLLSVLRRRTQELIQPEDVITTTASPQTIPQVGTNPYQPLPEIDDLVRRLAKVLYDEGEELLSDNILLQCRNLGKVGKNILNSQRAKLAKKAVDRYGWISSGVVAINPLPGVELLGTAVVNAQMVIEIAKVYGVQLTRARAKELALSVGKTITGLGLVQGGLTIVSTSLAMTLPGLVVGRAVQSVTAAWLTRLAGASFITYFKQDQDWGDGGMQEVIQRQYDIDRREESLRKFIDKALERIVEPLKRNQRRQLPPRQRPRGEVES